MRIQLTIKTDNNLIPFDHQTLLTNIIYQWLGYPKENHTMLPYSFSRLEGGRNTRDGIIFNNETTFFFSSPYAHQIEKLKQGIKHNPILLNNFKVTDTRIIEDPDLSKRELFYVASPIVLEADDGEHIIYNDTRADTYLKEEFQTRMKALEMIDDTFDLVFDKNYTNAGTKKIYINGIPGRGNWCHILIKGKPATKLLAWNTGLGHFTSVGFGAIM